jgi:hypothetical protein
MYCELKFALSSFSFHPQIKGLSLDLGMGKRTLPEKKGLMGRLHTEVVRPSIIIREGSFGGFVPVVVVYFPQPDI